MHLQPKMELDMLVCVWTNQMIQLFYPVNKQKLVNKIDIQNQNIWHMHWKIIKQKLFFLQSNASSRTHFKHHLVCVLNLSPLSLLWKHSRGLCFWKIACFCIGQYQKLATPAHLTDYSGEPKQNWIWQFPWFSQRSPKSPPSILLTYFLWGVFHLVLL